MQMPRSAVNQLGSHAAREGMFGCGNMANIKESENRLFLHTSSRLVRLLLDSMMPDKIGRLLIGHDVPRQHSSSPIRTFNRDNAARL